MTHHRPHRPKQERFALPQPVDERSAGQARLSTEQFGGSPHVGRHHRQHAGEQDGWFEGHEHDGNRGQRTGEVQRWKVGAVAVFVLVSVLVLASALWGHTPANTAGDNGGAAATAVGDGQLDPQPAPQRGEGPVPDGALDTHTAGELPPGAPFTEKPSGKFTAVGRPGASAGQGKERTYTYVVEVEQGIDGASFGGVDAFSAMIDATLANPKSWIADPAFKFVHVNPSDLPAGKEPDLRFQLVTAATTHDVCGFTYKLETSCFTSAGNRVVLNEARWIRGAMPFNGDVGSYRQYMINHELGHGIGYAVHQACRSNGALAPVMMQQTLSLNNRQLHDLNPEEIYGTDDTTCVPNPWPYPTGGPTPESKDVIGTRSNQ